MRFLRLNYFPFEFVKRHFLLLQINIHLNNIHKQDQAIAAHGLNDLSTNDVRDLCRIRGLTAAGRPENELTGLLSKWAS
jgi:hypothetical protein